MITPATWYFAILLGHEATVSTALQSLNGRSLRASHGTVTIDSEVGRGTTVTCAFPLDQTAERSAA